MKRKKDKGISADQSKTSEHPKFEVLTFRSPTGAHQAPPKLLHKPEQSDNAELSLEQEPEPENIGPIVFTAGAPENTPQFAASEMKKTTQTYAPMFSVNDAQQTSVSAPTSVLQRDRRSTLKTPAPEFALAPKIENTILDKKATKVATNSVLQRDRRNTLKTPAPHFVLDQELTKSLEHELDNTEELTSLPDPARTALSTIKTPIPILDPETVEDEESHSESLIVLTNPKNKS